MEWKKDKEYHETYSTSADFNGYTYNCVIWVWDTDKTLKYWVAISSGKKRKD